MDSPVYSCHLFAGAGGGLLADLLSGVRPLVAVELEPFPARILAARFPGLGVWDDVRTFREGNPECADAFAALRAVRDRLVVAGGFPCQDISSAGKGAGVRGGERSGLWREFARILGEIRPRFAFVENSPMLVGRGLDCVLADLAALGYDALWQIVSAADVGARHRRERIWICARLPGWGGGDWPTPTASGDLHYRLGGDSQGSRCLAALVRAAPADADRAGREEQRRAVPMGAPLPRAQRGGCAALWPTVTVHGNDNVRGATPNSGDGLTTAIRRRAGFWPSPQRRDFRSGQTAPHGWGARGITAQLNLNDAVIFPTPTRHDSTGAPPLK